MPQYKSRLLSLIVSILNSYSRHVKSDCKPEEKTESSSRSESTPRGGSSGELVPASSRSGEEDKLTAAKTNRVRIFGLTKAFDQ